MTPQFEPLVEVVRGPLVESVHFGTLVALSPSGAITGSVGDPDAVMFPRSANKLMQAAAMVELGLSLPPQLLALVAASHSGGDGHVSGVTEILAGCGLDQSHLACTPYLPSGASERRAYLADGGEPAAVRSDCSGKHAGFLATCLINGWPTDDYLSPTHPLQQAMKAATSKWTGEPVVAESVDGCGAPLWGFGLAGLARAFLAGVMAEPGEPIRQVADAMRAFPANVGGPGREATLAMQSLPGTLAKDGAEAVFAVAHAEHGGIAWKVADGSVRAIKPVLAAVIQTWGGRTDELEPAAILGGGKPVGRAQPTAETLAAICLA